MTSRSVNQHGEGRLCCAYGCDNTSVLSHDQTAMQHVMHAKITAFLENARSF